MELDYNPGNMGQFVQDWQTTLGDSLNPPYAIHSLAVRRG